MTDRLTDEMMGPAMKVLRGEKQRVFAFIMGTGAMNATAAAREAGFSDVAEGCKVRAHHLMHDPNVIAAIKEVAGNVLMGLAPLAIAQAKAMLEDRRHPAHARMVETVLDRTGFFAKTEHKVTVEHTVDEARMIEIAVRMGRELGFDPAKLVGPNRMDGDGKLIEGEAVERPEPEPAQGSDVPADRE